MRPLLALTGFTLLLFAFSSPARAQTTYTKTAADGSKVKVTVTKKKGRKLTAKEVAELRKKQQERKKKEALAKKLASKKAASQKTTSPAKPPTPVVVVPPKKRPKKSSLTTVPTAPPKLKSTRQMPASASAPDRVIAQRQSVSEIAEEASRSPKEMESTPTTLRLEANTDMPLHIGAGLLLETPARIRLRTGFGFVSKTYVSGANSLVKGFTDSYDDDDATLVENALGQSFLWRSQIGVRPFRTWGLYLHAGYSLVQISGSASGLEVVDAAIDLNQEERQAMMQAIDESSEVEIDSRLHMLDAELGWEWWPASHISLRMGLGWAYTIAANAQLRVKTDVTNDTEQQIVDQIEEEGSQRLSELYTSFFHPPSLNLAIGVRF